MNWGGYIAGKSRWIVFGLIPVMALLMHLHLLPLELRGVHAWRQTETASNIVNFYEEDFNLFNPRVNSLEWEDGLKRMEFPLMQWVMAGFYKVFGPHILIVRVLSLLIFLIGVFGMFRLGQALFGDELRATLLAWTYAWSPVLFYYCINPLPDNFALMAGIWGLAYFAKWHRQQRMVHLWWSALFLMLATLTKLPFILFYGVPFGFAFWAVLRSGFRRWGPNILVALPGLLSLAAPSAWYLTVIPTWHGNGVVAGILDATPDQQGEILNIFVQNLISTLPELLLNYGSVLAFMVGGAVIISQQLWKKPLFPAFLIMGLGVFAFYLFEINLIGTAHDYYLFPFLPGLFLFIAIGAAHLLQNRQKWLGLVMGVTLVLLPLFAGLRAYSRWEINSNPDLFEFREELRTAVPDDARVLVGEDLSPHIYLYHLHKKGWHIHPGELTPDKMAWRMEQGAAYFYNDTPLYEEHPYIENHLDRVVAEIGSFRVWKLK